MQQRHLKTTESDFGSGTIKRVPKNVPSVHMFHKVHFFLLFFVRFVLNNPRLSSLVKKKEEEKKKGVSFNPPPFSISFFNCMGFFVI